VPKHAAAAPASDTGSDIKSSSGGGKAAVSADAPAAPVMLLDCRTFELELEREGAVKALGVVDTPIDDPRFNAITKSVRPLPAS
jgi:hypothetical protein